MAQVNGSVPSPDTDGWDPPKRKSDREIFLSRGYIALVDARSYPFIAYHPSGRPKKWTADVQPGGIVYAVRLSTNEDLRLRSNKRKRFKIYMHREVKKVIDEPFLEVDHIWHNTLDNRVKCLEVVDHFANGQHTRAGRGISGMRGVVCKRDCLRAKPWQAALNFRGQKHHIGYFATPGEAARAYDRKVVELLSDLPIRIILSRLNFPRDPETKMHLRALMREKKRHEPPRMRLLHQVDEEVPF